MAVLNSVALLVATLFTSVIIDVQVHENDFSKSFTGQTLKGYGGYEYGLLAYEKYLDGKKWVIAKTPEYVDGFMEWSEPYRRLSRDLGLIALNAATHAYKKATSYINEQLPVAQYWYVYYFGFCLLPGPISGVIQGHSLIAHMHSLLPQTKVEKNLPGIKDASYKAAVQAFTLARNNTILVAQYFQNDVFVGKLSPESMKNMTWEAYNSTQELASSTMSWIYKTLYPPPSKT